MKLRCPRCQKKLSIPDKYAGKTIRCPACNRAFQVPALSAGTGAHLDASKLDLEGLASLETQSEEMERKELAAAQAGVAQKRQATIADPSVRVCPHCGKEVKAKDPSSELLCSHCWNTIPAQTARHVDHAQAAGGTDTGSFYGQLASCITYPLPAISSMLTAAVIAAAAGLVPVAIMTAMTYIMKQGDVGLAGAHTSVTNLTGVQWVLVAIFSAEIFFFTAVAIHTFLDVIRASTIGNSAPPNLGWAPVHWGKSLAGYLTLVAYYAVMTLLILWLTIDDPKAILMRGDVVAIGHEGGAALIVGMVIISLGVPMNLLGLALGSVAQAVNPVNVLRSIARTHVHFVFLLILVFVYGALFASAFVAIIFNWFVPHVGAMVKGSAEGNVGQVALALLVWGVVMAFYFYGMYVLARMHGLFARTFRKELSF